MYFVVKRASGAIFSIHFDAKVAYAKCEELNRSGKGRYWLERKLRATGKAI